MRKLVLILVALIAVATFIRAYQIPEDMQSVQIQEAAIEL